MTHHNSHPHTSHPHTSHPHTSHPHTSHPHTSHPHTSHPHTSHPHTSHPHTSHPHTSHMTTHTLSPQTLWIERTTFHTAHQFPGEMAWFEVSKVEEVHMYYNIQEHATVLGERTQVLPSLTLGVHAQRGLRYLVRVCVSVCPLHFGHYE